MISFRRRSGVVEWKLLVSELEAGSQVFMLCCSKKEAALAKRKDAGKRIVVITEKWDRKGQQYAAKAVPFPFDSRDTYERSLRQPLGSDFNTTASFKCAQLYLPYHLYHLICLYCFRINVSSTIMCSA